MYTDGSHPMIVIIRFFPEVLAHELSHFVYILLDVVVLLVADKFPLPVPALFHDHTDAVHLVYWVHLLNF
jgi:hypothetical protein